MTPRIPLQGSRQMEMDSTLRRLCPIYLRDVLSLTSRPQIDKCQRVSSSIHAVIASSPESRLPKRMFEMFVQVSRPHQ
jgi:hypothetical protein